MCEKWGCFSITRIYVHYMGIIWATDLNRHMVESGLFRSHWKSIIITHTCVYECVCLCVYLRLYILKHHMPALGPITDVSLSRSTREKDQKQNNGISLSEKINSWVICFHLRKSSIYRWQHCLKKTLTSSILEERWTGRSW